MTRRRSSATRCCDQSFVNPTVEFYWTNFELVVEVSLLATTEGACERVLGSWFFTLYVYGYKVGVHVARGYLR